MGLLQVSLQQAGAVTIVIGGVAIGSSTSPHITFLWACTGWERIGSETVDDDINVELFNPDIRGLRMEPIDFYYADMHRVFESLHFLYRLLSLGPLWAKNSVELVEANK